jgi:hypothetical protein
MAAPRSIGLLTDFGTADHYVGVMKAVIASIAPRAAVIDISHEVSSYSINQARFLLGQAWPWFPKSSVLVAVVDPGVGSSRRAVLVEAQSRLFLAPDNGLLTDLLEAPKARVRQIANSELFLPEISSTFHGRDIFAPVAARLATGTLPARVGPRILDPVSLPPLEPIRTGRRFWQSEVLHVDKFGNVATGFSAAAFPQVAQNRFELKIGLTALRRTASCYADAPPGEPFVIAASHGYLEVSLKESSAAKHLGVAPGSPVELEIW